MRRPPPCRSPRTRRCCCCGRAAPPGQDVRAPRGEGQRHHSRTPTLRLANRRKCRISPASQVATRQRNADQPQTLCHNLRPNLPQAPRVGSTPSLVSSYSSGTRQARKPPMKDGFVLAAMRWNILTSFPRSVSLPSEWTCNPEIPPVDREPALGDDDYVEAHPLGAFLKKRPMPWPLAVPGKNQRRLHLECANPRAIHEVIIPQGGKRGLAARARVSA